MKLAVASGCLLIVALVVFLFGYSSSFARPVPGQTTQQQQTLQELQQDVRSLREQSQRLTALTKALATSNSAESEALPMPPAPGQDQRTQAAARVNGRTAERPSEPADVRAENLTLSQDWDAQRRSGVNDPSGYRTLKGALVDAGLPLSEAAADDGCSEGICRFTLALEGSTHALADVVDDTLATADPTRKSFTILRLPDGTVQLFAFDRAKLSRG